MSTVAFTAQSLGAGETPELRAILVRGLIVAALIGAALIALQIPLAADPARRDGRQRGRHARGQNLLHRSGSGRRRWRSRNYVVLGWLIGQARAKLALGDADRDQPHQRWRRPSLLVLVLDSGIAGAAHRRRDRGSGRARARHPDRAPPDATDSSPSPRATLFDRAKLMRMLAVNRDIMIRTAVADRGVPVLHRAGRPRRRRDARRQRGAEQFSADQRLLPRRPRQRRRAALRPRLWRPRQAAFAGAVRLVVMWGFGFALAVTAVFALFGPALIDIMTASAERAAHRARLSAVRDRLRRCSACSPSPMTAIYIGATWARDMRNLMVAVAADLPRRVVCAALVRQCRAVGALLVHYAARGGLEALRYPALLRKSFMT